MAILLDPAEPEVGEAVDAGRTILRRLRAQPLLEQLDAAVARTRAAPADASATLTAVTRATT
jgi:hypothetical protein